MYHCVHAVDIDWYAYAHEHNIYGKVDYVYIPKRDVIYMHAYVRTLCSFIYTIPFSRYNTLLYSNINITETGTTPCVISRSIF